MENKIDMINKNYENYKNNYSKNIQIEKTPQFISALEEKQNALLKEFDNKLQEFQKEKNKNSNNNEEIERYKQLILKQREMMSSLTKKENEREEMILQLQEDNEVYEKINEQQENNIFLLNQNFKNLIDYCQNKMKINDLNIENYLNVYKKINNEISFYKKENTNNKNIINNKNDNTKQSNIKKYLPYNNNVNNNNNNSLNSTVSIFNNININPETPIILLTADEKIKELKGIIKEKEDEVNILKLVSQKFLSNSCQTKEGKINLAEIKNSFQNGFEIHTKIRELEDENQKLKNENDILNEKLVELHNSISKIQNILEDIKLNNINNVNYVPSKNESLEKIVANLNVGQAIDDIHKIINTMTNNIGNMNNKNINLINKSYTSEELLLKINKNNSMDKDITYDKDLIKTINNTKEKRASRNGFNPKIEQIISFHDRNNNFNSDQFIINSTFSLNNSERKIKDNNLARIANSLDNKSISKKQYRKEKKFLNKFINVDK